VNKIQSHVPFGVQSAGYKISMSQKKSNFSSSEKIHRKTCFSIHQIRKMQKLMSEGDRDLTDLRLMFSIVAESHLYKN
jgi:hypothetical protein